MTDAIIKLMSVEVAEAGNPLEQHQKVLEVVRSCLTFGGFLKWGYPPNIPNHPFLDGIFHSKP